MSELDLFPDNIDQSTQLLITHFDNKSRRFGFKLLKELREKGISSEIYPDIVKLKKQLTYANRKNIPFVIVIGSDEMESGNLTLKNMISGEQYSDKVSALVKIIQA